MLSGVELCKISRPKGYLNLQECRPMLTHRMTGLAGRCSCSAKASQQGMPDLAALTGAKAGHINVCQTWTHWLVPELATLTCAKAGHTNECQNWPHQRVPDLITITGGTSLQAFMPDLVTLMGGTSFQASRLRLGWQVAGKSLANAPGPTLG